MRITLLPDDATEEKLRGVSKDTRSSDSSRKAFVRKVREIGVAVKLVNLHIGGYKKMLAALEEKLLAESVVREKNRFLLFSRSWNEDCLSV